MAYLPLKNLPVDSNKSTASEMTQYKLNGSQLKNFNLQREFLMYIGNETLMSSVLLSGVEGKM